MTVFVWGEVMILKFASLRTADAFPVVASLPRRPEMRLEATTGNASAVRRLQICGKYEIKVQ